MRVLERKYIKVKSDETTAVGAPLRDPAFQRIWLGLSMNRFHVAALAILKAAQSTLTRNLAHHSD